MADDDGARAVLPPGMAMSAVTIASLTRRDGYARVVLEAAELAGLRPRGAAPVFKVFIPEHPGADPVPPSFDAKYLPVWPEGAPRPTVRSYTALEFSATGGTIEFLAYDHGHGGWWLDRFGPGDTVGVIGFKHEVLVDDGTETVVAAGDASAAGAVAALARRLPPRVRLYAAGPEAAWPDGLLDGRPDAELVAAPVDEHGFPAVTWARLAPHAGSSPVLWLGGERSSVARLRSEAVDAGVDPVRITSMPYWLAGRTRDEFDAELSARYREAAARGQDLGDPLLVARIELG